MPDAPRTSLRRRRVNRVDVEQSAGLTRLGAPAYSGPSVRTLGRALMCALKSLVLHTN